jgi:hypothetical protein
MNMEEMERWGAPYEEQLGPGGGHEAPGGYAATREGRLGCGRPRREG